jgi:hypothetical protein
VGKKMKKYEYIGGVESLDELSDLGYFDNVMDMIEQPIEVINGKFEAIKTFPKDMVAVSIHGKSVEVYEYMGEENNHIRTKRCEHPEKYVQDLLDDLLIREVTDE